MTSRGFFIDWGTQVAVATSTSDAHLTVPTDTPIAQAAGQANSIGGSWWVFGVAGADTYINANAAATSANARVPAGVVDWIPKRYPPGTTIHGLTVSGSGQIWIARCRQVD